MTLFNPRNKAAFGPSSSCAVGAGFASLIRALLALQAASVPLIRIRAHQTPNSCNVLMRHAPHPAPAAYRAVWRADRCRAADLRCTAGSVLPFGRQTATRAIRAQHVGQLQLLQRGFAGAVFGQPRGDLFGVGRGLILQVQPETTELSMPKGMFSRAPARSPAVAACPE